MRTKLNIFKLTFILFIIAYIFLVLFFILITFTGGHTIPKEMVRNTFLGSDILINFYSYFMFELIKDFIAIYALITLLKVIDRFAKQCYFSLKTIELVRKSGILFIAVAVLGALNSIFYHHTFSNNIIESLLLPGMIHCVTLIIGIGLLVIEETYQRGLYIKTENDLTI